MAMFVHLTTESRTSQVKRNGIACLRKAVGSLPSGVYAVPVARDFYASHQWLRELKRRNRGPIAGIYFRIPDEQPVWLGHYGQVHRVVSAAEAVAQFMRADDPLGWQVVIPRRIEAKEIHKIRRLPQVTGWRFSPKAKGKPPFARANSVLAANTAARSYENDLAHPMMSDIGIFRQPS